MNIFLLISLFFVAAFFASLITGLFYENNASFVAVFVSGLCIVVFGLAALAVDVKEERQARLERCDQISESYSTYWDGENCVVFLDDTITIRAYSIEIDKRSFTDED